MKFGMIFFSSGLWKVLGVGEGAFGVMWGRDGVATI